MNGAQDFGGQMGFGPVLNEIDEPWFHAPWEARALALTLAMGATGTWNIDTSRHARESLPPVVYLASSYYEIWMRGLAKLMVAHGLVTDEELDSGKMLQPPASVKRVLKAADVPTALARGGPCDRPCDAPARFKQGDKIRCKKDHFATHTRLPRYIRGAVGEVVANNGAFVFPDSNAHGRGESPTWCYSVRFDAQELWGAGADPLSDVMVDCWEPYLEQL